MLRRLFQHLLRIWHRMSLGLGHSAEQSPAPSSGAPAPFTCMHPCEASDGSILINAESHAAIQHLPHAWFDAFCKHDLGNALPWQVS